MGLKILLGGQDITSAVDELSIQIQDTLGQGPGTNSVNSGRAATAQFNTTLGPASSAVGAGTVVHTPTLLRGGQIQIFDASNTAIFGGFVGKIDDITVKKFVQSTVYAYDYYQELDRIQVQTYYSGVSDTFMIKDLFKNFAPWVDTSLIPNAGNYTFTAKVFKAISLQKALNAITDITGWIIWVDPTAKAHYVSPLNTQSAPFSLSDSPDFITKFNHGFDSLEIDDTSAVNRVTFYGGKKLSLDFIQDLSTQANGSNTLFVLAYYPHACADGKYHIQANGSGDLVLGYVSGTGPKNTLKSAGGICDVLLNTDAHTLLFNTAPSNGGPNSVTAKYRYDYPMVVQVIDTVSFAFFGRYLDAPISDETVFDTATAVARCRTLLAEQSKGLTTLKVHCWRPGLQSGQTVGVFNAIRGINLQYLIQEVDVKPLGGGQFEYDLTLGAWSWNLVDVLISATNAAYNAGLAPTNDNTNGVQTNAIQVEQVSSNMGAHMTLSESTRLWGWYYARSSAVGDGHDAYAGLFSVCDTGTLYGLISSFGPLRYYRMNETSGTNVVDYGTQALNGTINGGITLNQPSILFSGASPCMLLDGTSGYISAATTGLPTGAQPWSLVAFIKMPSVPFSGLHAIAEFGSGATNQAAVLFVDSAGKLCANTYNGNKIAGPVASNNTLYCVVGTYDGTSLKLYTNGTLQGTLACTPAIALSYFRIGSEDTGPVDDFYGGYASDVAAFNFALSSTQVTQISNMGRLGHL